MAQNEILQMSNYRYDIIHSVNNHEYGDSTEEELRAKIDELAKTIESHIHLHFDSLPFEFIMEELSKLGQAPNLLYDDNGNWAVTSTGYQNVVYGDEPEDVETHFFIEAKFWKPTPREALNYYLTYEEDEE